MQRIERYIEAATRDNTRRGYRAAIRHYEETWGGLLPATAESVARYLADHAEQLALNTLRLHLAALARWHRDQGFPDPTKAPVVRQVMRGISELHPAREHQARALQLEDLVRVDAMLETRIREAGISEALRARRDRALLLVGFWRAFRGDELLRLAVEDVRQEHDGGLLIRLARTKTSHGESRDYPLPRLSRLCPVTAYADWVGCAGIERGAVFRGIDRWGRVREQGLHPNSLIPLLRRLLEEAGVADAASYSAHSLRRGFASWASASQWQLRELMDYVGWRDARSALRYIERAAPRLGGRIERALAAPEDASG
ncbi:site-specific integrase [Marichromatium bheemlicum]|uniref:Site-specific integrase n=1 Tax=Marichromatium bheemlicum TaxID=365339 RepID=A0ABX1I4X5_9GAMM|nr:site-specific integrase [Marichromatium bheemlicum]NKN32477.1 site-specific integrase [Marichromatium bheemlicum]